MANDIIIPGDDLSFEIDFVFPYVDNMDPNWIKQHELMCKKNNIITNPNDAKYRDYGTLKYLFRGLAKYMPWIRNVYMIVEQPSQVPEWLDQNKVKIIYHKDIIPSSKLPTYNSTTIEMFLHKIPNLSEHFIYSNDDLFPTYHLKKSNFFTPDGTPRFIMSYIPCNLERTSVYRKHVRNSNDMAAKDTGFKMGERDHIYKSNHGMTPMVLSNCRYIVEKYRQDIMNSCSSFRQNFNINQELYKSWNYFNKSYNHKNVVDLAYICIEDIKSSQDLFDQFKASATVCLNDSKFKDKASSFERIKKYITTAFEMYFPSVCKYEKH